MINYFTKFILYNTLQPFKINSYRVLINSIYE
jgi:hypothetical protein